MLRCLQVCVDAFFLTQGYVDVATFSVLTTTTCGSLYHYSPFEAAVDSDAFHNDLRWNVIRPQASCLLAGKVATAYQPAHALLDNYSW